MKPFALLALFFVAGCQTVYCGRLLPLTEYERANMSCDGLDAEIAKAEQFKASVRRDPKLGSEVLANEHERLEATRSADLRIESCRSAKDEKGCH